MQSCASRQDHHKEKEIQQQTQWIPLKIKQQPAVQSPEREYFTVSNRQVLKKSLHMFDTHKKRINEQCDSIQCAKKRDGGA